jgi:oligosaccharyltransferase complex subunit delta (ribophorin II)
VKYSADAGDVRSLFFATSAANNIKASKSTDCSFPTGEKEALLNAAITEEASSETIFHAVATLSNLGLKVDAKKVMAAVDAALKADDSALSHAYAFYAVSYLTGDLKKYHDLIEDIVAQADEVDEKYLQVCCFQGNNIECNECIWKCFYFSV